jgi:hypothetical protein
MAGPHATGLVALMWSANPALRGLVTETMQIIGDTARPLTGQPGSNCGGNYTVGPNNDWGYGTLDALAAVQEGNHYGDPGTLAGAVTDGSTGLGLVGASVQATASLTRTVQTTTGAGGTYSTLLISDTYTVTASAYGYQPQTISGVSVVSGTTTTLNFQLTPAPTYVVSGVVSDPNTGWPLYARIDAAGYPGGPVWTDPVSGFYSVPLVAGIPYHFNVTAWLDGYQVASRPVGPLAGNQTENFALTADLAACAAPGYRRQYVYFSDFEANNAGFTAAGITSWEWGTPTSGPGSAHSGFKAWATNLSGDYNNDEDGYTVSPPIDLSAYAGQPLTLSWWQWLSTEQGFDYASVEVSNDSGATWTRVYGEVSGPVDTHWTEHGLALSPDYAVRNFRVRFRLRSDFSITYPGYYVDDVGISLACVAGTGGLLVGHVYDANTGHGLNGASVASLDATADTTTALDTPDDPAVADGFYLLYSSLTGDHPFTAARSGGYGDDGQTVNVVSGDAVPQDFHLPAGYLSTVPTSLTVTLPASQTTRLDLTLNNTGGLAAGFHVIEVNAPPPSLGSAGPFARSIPRVSPKHLHDPHALAVPGYNPPEAAMLAGGKVITTWPTSLTYAWGIGFNTDAHDLWLGNIAIAGGDDLDYRFLTDGTNTGDTIDTAPWGGVFAADLAYNPLTGMLWQVNVGGDNCIYELDPVRRVSTGDKICPGFEVSQRGLAYDPTTDTFYAGSWNDGLIHHFDASGAVLDSSDVGLLTSGLAFNPATRHLFVMTNSSEGLDVYVLDAQNDYAVVGGFNLSDLDYYEQAGLELDCTGYLWAVNQYTQWVIVADSGEVGMCAWKDIPWLSEAAASGDIAAGGVQAVTLTFDATGLAAGVHQAHLRIREDTPYRAPSIPVTLIVTAPPPAPGDNKVFLPMINKN